MSRVGKNPIAIPTGVKITMLDGMLQLRHPNGSPRLRVYGPHDMNDRGATVAFNMLDADGEVVYHDDVVHQAGLKQISLRGGCFCNPGAAEAAFAFKQHALRAGAGGCDRRRDGQTPPNRCGIDGPASG